MKIQLKNGFAVEFEDYGKDGWEGEFVMELRSFYFSIEKQNIIDWEDIKDRILYFEKHFKEIIEITNEGIIEHLAYMNWDKKLKFEIDIINLPIEKNREDLFIFEPYFFDDPYVVWTAHIQDDNGPKLKKVLRQ